MNPQQVNFAGRQVLRRILQAARPALLLGCLLPGITPGLVFAQWVDHDEKRQDVVTSTAEAVKEIEQPFSDADHTPPPPEDAVGTVDACDWQLEGQPIQEQSQEVLRSWSCHSFRWFDSWWGDERDFNEGAVNGLITVGTEWRSYDGFDPRLRFRVRAPLPNLDNRFDLLLGRVNEEAFISDTQAQDAMFYNPGIVNRGREDSWLLGLGHRRQGRKSGWDTSFGVRLRLPPSLYGKLSYFFNHRFTPKTDLRFRQTFFWRGDGEGFGTTSRGDLAHGININNVLRWEGIVTVSEKSEGARWYFGQTWYHLLGNRSAFSLLTFAQGETSAPSDLKDMGFNLIWRRPFTREWMYLSLGPSFTWPRFEAEENREFSLGFNLWIEMEFGNWRY